MPAATSDVSIHPLTPERWNDLQALLEEAGDPKWCLYKSQVGKHGA